MNNIAFTTSAFQKLNHERERTSLPPSSSAPYLILIDTDNKAPQNGNSQDTETLESDENCMSCTSSYGSQYSDVSYLDSNGFDQQQPLHAAGCCSDDSDISYLDLNDVEEASPLGLGVPTPLLDEDGESDIGCDMVKYLCGFR